MRYFIWFPALNQGTTTLENEVDYSIWDNMWSVIIQNVNSGSVIWEAMESVLLVQWGVLQSALYASDILDAQHKLVFCVFHTNFIGVTADIQQMRSMEHLSHWYLSSQTSRHHTSNESDVKHSNYFIQKLLQVLMCTT